MATRRKSAARTPKVKPITEEDVKAAVDVIRREYYQEVRQYGDDLLEMVKSGEISDDQALTERLEQDVDSSARVIYTFQSKLGLLVSDNDEAYEQEFGEPPPDDARQMYAAMIADIRDYMGDVKFPDAD